MTHLVWSFICYREFMKLNTFHAESHAPANCSSHQTRPRARLGRPDIGRLIERVGMSHLSWLETQTDAKNLRNCRFYRTWF